MTRSVDLWMSVVYSIVKPQTNLTSVVHSNGVIVSVEPVAKVGMSSFNSVVVAVDNKLNSAVPDIEFIIIAVESDRDL